MAFGAKIKLKVNTSGASAFRTEIQNYVNSATSSKPIVIKNITIKLANPKTQLSQIRNQLNQAGGIGSVNLKEINATGAINKLRKDIQYMLSGLNIVGLKEFLGAEGITAAAGDINKAKEAASAWASQLQVVNDISKKLSTSYKGALSGNQMITNSAELTQITAAYTAWQQKVEQLRATKVALSAEELTSLQNEGIAIQQKISLLQREQAEATKAANAKKTDAVDAEAAAKKELALTQQTITLRSQVQRYILSNSKAYKAYGADLDGIMFALRDEANLSEEALKRLKIRFSEIKTEADAAGLSGNTFFTTLKKGWEKFGGWSLVTKTMMTAYRTIKNMVKAVKELDSAMTELKKVTDLSNQSYENYLKKATSMSKEVGASLADTVNATADFARLGYNIEDSSSLAEAALVYKNVGDGIEDISEASESIISTIKAFEQFGVSAENAMDIVDKFNEVGNNFAISSQGIGVALQKSASSLAAAGNDLSESIALITAANAVVQNPEVVGTAMKTMSMYLRAAKTEAEEAGEATDGMASSVSELRKELLTLTKGKVDIMIDDTTFKSTYQIMKDLSEVWASITDVDKANILELIGGKRNATTVTSLLTNFKDAEAALASANNAVGSATKENEKYLDSIAGKLSILEAKFEAMSNNLIDSGFVKIVLDVASALMSLFELLSKFPFILSTIATSAALVGKHTQARNIEQLTSRIVLQKGAILSEGAATDQLSISLAGLNKAQQRLLVTELQRKVTTDEITRDEYEQIVATLGLSGAEATLTATNAGLAASFKSLMTSIPVWGWISLGITLIMESTSVISNLVDSIETAEEKATRLKEEWDGLTSKIQETSNAFRSMRDEANDIIPRFVELAKGVNEFGEQVSLTDEEYAEFLDLNNRIAEMFPELNLGMNSSGNAMLSLSYSADTLTASLEGLIDAERKAANAEVAKTMPDLMSNITGQMDGYNKQIEDASDNIDDAIKLITDKSKGSYDFKLNTTSTDPKKIGRFSDEYYEYIATLKKYGIEYEVKKAAPASTWVDVIIKDQDAAIKALESGKDKMKKAIESEKESVWRELNGVVSAWLQTDPLYDNLDETGQNIVLSIANGIDFSKAGLTTAEQVQNYVKDNIVTPFYNAEPEVKGAIYSMFTVNDLFNSDQIDVGEYKVVIDKFLEELKNSGYNDEQIKTLKIGLDITDFEDKYNHVVKLVHDDKGGTVPIAEDLENQIKSLSAKDIEIAYLIEEADGSMTFDELTAKIEELRFKNAPMVDVLDFDNMVDGLDKAKAGMDNLINAMSKLKSGTALTKQELAQLALEYPKLLEASDLFTDGSIQGQKNMLNTILDMQEQEYDAEIDKKIAELEATEQVLNNQLALEEDKANLLQEIKNFEVTGIQDQDEQLVNKIREYNNLQGKNFVSMQDGILTVNQEALNNQLDEQKDFGDKSATNIWSPFARTISSAFEKGGSSGLTALNNVGSKMKDWGQRISDNILTPIANGIKGLLNGEGFSGFKGLWTGISTVVSGKDVTVTFNGKDVSVDDEPLNGWVDKQIEANEERIEQTKDLLNRTVNAKNNLLALKGLDLAEVYGNSNDKDGSDKDKDKTEEYIAEVERYAEALQRLHDIEVKQAKLERDLENADSATEKVRIQKELNQVYAERQDALNHLNNLRDKTIHDSIPYLQQLGFEVEYNDETNRFYIANLEHLNELEADTVGEHENLQEATNALRKDTEELIDDLTTLNEANEEGSQTWLELADSIEEGKEKIIEFIEEVVTEANELVDSFEEVYSTITDAASEYASTGYLGVDTLQSILSLAPKYLKYLYDENGQLVLNEETLQAVIAAKTEDMAAETALAYAKKILIAVQEDDIDTLGTLTQATYNSSEATWGAAYATLGLAKAMGTAKGMDAGYFEDAVGYLTRMQSLTKTATDSIPQYYQSLKSGYKSQADGLSEIISLTQDLIQWESEQKIESLEKEKESYREIIEAKKELLQLSKEQEDHEDDVADKLKEIAKLQSRIDQLSLDDSREAQAEKKQLEEELSELQKDFADSQADYAYNTQIDALDKELEAFEEAKDDEIKEQEEMLDSAEELYQAAVERITENWGDNWEGFYQELLGWNNEYGSTLETELTSAWDAATAAAQRYGSIAAAITGVNDNTKLGSFGDTDSIISSMGQNAISWLTASSNERTALEEANRQLASQYESLTGEKLTISNGIWYKANGKELFKYSNEEVATAIVSAMKSNSSAYNNTTDTDERQALVQRNEELAALLEERLGETIVKGSNGVWYIGSEGGTQLYRKYHTGGIAGDKSTLEQDEVMAILKEGELVLDENREHALYEIVDFVSSLSERLGKAINVNKLGGIASMLMLSTDTSTAPTPTPSSSNNIEINPSVKVEIHHNGDLDENDAKRYGNIAAESVLQELNDAFNKRGINSFGGTLK